MAKLKDFITAGLAIQLPATTIFGVAMRHTRGRSLDAFDAELAGHRHQRLERLLFEEIDALFRDEVSDPVLTQLRVAVVQLSPDYRNARVTLCPSSSPAPDGDGVMRALTRAAPFLRARVAEAVELKHSPLVSYGYDPTLSPQPRTE